MIGYSRREVELKIYKRHCTFSPDQDTHFFLPRESKSWSSHVNNPPIFPSLETNQVGKEGLSREWKGLSQVTEPALKHRRQSSVGSSRQFFDLMWQDSREDGSQRGSCICWLENEKDLAISNLYQSTLARGRIGDAPVQAIEMMKELVRHQL